jgi:hypothetical protein
VVRFDVSRRDWCGMLCGKSNFGRRRQLFPLAFFCHAAGDHSLMEFCSVGVDVCVGDTLETLTLLLREFLWVQQLWHRKGQLVAVCAYCFYFGSGLESTCRLIMDALLYTTYSRVYPGKKGK